MNVEHALRRLKNLLRLCGRTLFACFQVTFMPYNLRPFAFLACSRAVCWDLKLSMSSSKTPEYHAPAVLNENRQPKTLECLFAEAPCYSPDIFDQRDVVPLPFLSPSDFIFAREVQA